MNVTAPFKLQAYGLATDKLERARLAEATNALKFEGDRIYADNFDGIGFVNDVKRNLGFPCRANACCCSVPAVPRTACCNRCSTSGRRRS